MYHSIGDISYGEESIMLSLAWLSQQQPTCLKGGVPVLQCVGKSSTWDPQNIAIPKMAVWRQNASIHGNCKCLQLTIVLPV